ncbi:MAG: chemotaxis protein CheX [Chloroflexi bacterium]|nr:chemotaxis protein CheX [Chloroflexota bacterium]
MNVKFLNPFVEAATEVLKAEAQATVDRGMLSLQKSMLTTDDITVLINLVGQLQGVVLYGMAKATGIALVSRMLDQPFQEMDLLAQSGVAELGNVISGRATIKLADAGLNTTISPPTLITGNGIQISTLDFQRIVVPLRTEMGEITVHLAVRENNQEFLPGSTVRLIEGATTSPRAE